MSHLYGTIPVSARKTAATARAHRDLKTIAASYLGAIEVGMIYKPAEYARVQVGTHKNGRPRYVNRMTAVERVEYVVTMRDWHGAGVNRVIEQGTLYPQSYWKGVSEYGALNGNASHTALAELLKDKADA